MKIYCAAFALTVLACVGYSTRAFSECCPVHRPERPDISDPGAWARSEQRVTTDAKVVSIDDGVLTIEVSGKRFASTPDKGTKFSAEKWTELAGRKNLTLADFAVGASVKVTFLADSGKLMEVRLRHEKLLDAQSSSPSVARVSR